MKFATILAKLHFLSILLLFALPASSNYQLKSYGFGSGQDNMQSTNYNIEGVVDQSASNLNSANYNIEGGYLRLQQADVPSAPTFSNDKNWYNKLKIIIDPGNNASDTTFSIAISDDNWVNTSYVQSDDTIGPTLNTSNYRNYTNWGGTNGTIIIGLSSSTTYQIKIRSNHGIFTESGWGSVATASTVSPYITFDIDIADNVSGSTIETASPYVLNIGDLNPGSVTTANNAIWIDLETNAESGAYVYLSANNSGLTSATTNYTIISVSGDLNALNEGFGAQINTTNQASDGPLSGILPYNGVTNSVGIIDTNFREIFSTSGNPIYAGRGSLLLKTKIKATTPAATDYQQTVDIITSASF